jgi:uracil-DNA glycosylase
MPASAVARDLASRLVATLPQGLPTLFNPWVDRCPEDLPWNTPQAKLDRLAAHLDCNPRVILCGEAPGYQGCRHSGVAFTSERLLLEGSIPRINAPQERLTHRKLPYSEPSATVIWGALRAQGLEEHAILWNAVQLHPHPAGQPGKNRTPSPSEVALGAPALRLLLEAFPHARVVAVGQKAAGLLAKMGVADVTTIRHPANGGATECRQGIAGLVAP